MADRRYFSCWLATIVPLADIERSPSFAVTSTSVAFAGIFATSTLSSSARSFSTRTVPSAATTRFISVRKGGSSRSPVGPTLAGNSSRAERGSSRAESRGAHRQFYAVEKQLRENGNGDWKDLDRLERFQRILAERQARSLPVLKKLGDWLEAESPRVLPKNPIREAMDYARNNWTALISTSTMVIWRSTTTPPSEHCGASPSDGDWLFLGSDRGGRPAAAHYSLIASCLRNNVEPFAYACSIAASEGRSPGCAGHPWAVRRPGRQRR